MRSQCFTETPFQRPNIPNTPNPMRVSCLFPYQNLLSLPSSSIPTQSRSVTQCLSPIGHLGVAGADEGATLTVGVTASAALAGVRVSHFGAAGGDDEGDLLTLGVTGSTDLKLSDDRFESTSVMSEGRLGAIGAAEGVSLTLGVTGAWHTFSSDLIGGGVVFRFDAELATRREVGGVEPSPLPDPWTPTFLAAAAIRILQEPQFWCMS